MTILAAVLAPSAVSFAGCGTQEAETTQPAAVSSAAAESTPVESTAAPVTDTASVVGQWESAYFVDGEGNELTMEEYVAAQGVDTQGIDISMVFTLNEDGTGDASMSGISVPITYTFDGQVITYTIVSEGEASGQSASFQYDAENDALTYSAEGSDYTTVMTRKA